MRAGAKPCRLTPAALGDLQEIWRFTAKTWSMDQADAYVTGLAAAIERIGENPKLARERTELTPPVRIHRHQAHILIYREESDFVRIIRIRHGREDWANDPGSVEE